MNCKKGDIAVVVGGKYGNEGRIVQCLRIATKEDFKFYLTEYISAPAWIVDVALMGSLFATPIAPDKWLRPLRDNDGQDEMLRIAGLPKTLETV